MSTQVTNTQAFMFTQIPRSISKTWTSAIMNVETKRPVPSPGRYHENSIVERITLSVDFSDLLITPPSAFDTSTDADTSQIEIWQEARKDWTSLDHAITNTINEFIQRAIERAKDHKVTTIDALTETKTRCADVSSVSEEEAETATIIPHRLRRESSYPTRSEVHFANRVETVGPNDSASNIASPDIRSIVRSTIRQERNRSRGKTSRSILGAFAGVK